MPIEQPRVARYTATILWGTGTTVDTSAYDDVTPYYLNQPGLSVDGIGRDQIRAYSPPATPAFDLTLNNWDRRFSPGGPIGGFVGRGSDTYLDCLWGADPGCNSDVGADDQTTPANGIETARLFDGILNTAEHTLTRPQRSVQLRALGHLSILLDKKPRDDRDSDGNPIAPKLHENIRTDQAVSIILDGVGWPKGKRVIGESETHLLYWWLDGETSGLDALNALLGAEGAGACAYEQAGVFHWEGRETRQVNPRSTDTQWIFTDGVAADPSADAANILANDPNALANGQSELLLLAVNPSEYQSNPDEVVASVAAIINQRAPVPAQTGGDPPEVGKIWEYGAPFDLSPGQVVVTETLLSDPYRDAVAPVPDGVGPGPYDYHIEPEAAAPTIAMELLQSSGIRVRIRWTNTGGSTVVVRGVTSNGPQLRAVSLPVASELTVRSNIDTSAMATRYAAREMQWAMWAEASIGESQSVVNSMCLRYMQERRQATIRVANVDAKHMHAMLHFAVSDRVTWVQAHGAINEPYWIEQISHEISPGGALHVVTLGMERVFSVIGGRFDAAKFSVNVFGE